MQEETVFLWFELEYNVYVLFSRKRIRVHARRRGKSAASNTYHTYIEYIEYMLSTRVFRVIFRMRMFRMYVW